MKKFTGIIAGLMIMAFALAGCGSSKLGENYSEDKLKAAAESVIENTSEGNYKAVLEGASDELKAVLSEAKLKEVWDLYGEKGKLEEITKMKFEEKDGYGVVTAIAKYEKKKIQFTLSYNEDMELSGFWLR